jgi:YD repeat-containing protein
MKFNYNSPTADIISSVVDNVNGSSTAIETHSYDGARNGLSSSLASVGTGPAVEQVTIPAPYYSSFGITQVSDSIAGDSPTTYGYQTIAGRNFVNSVNGSGCSSCGGRGNQALSYDNQGNVVSSTDALGNTTTFVPVSFGNVLSKSVQLDGSTIYTWTSSYNQFQEAVTATDALGTGGDPSLRTPPSTPTTPTATCSPPHLRRTGSCPARKLLLPTTPMAIRKPKRRPSA